MSNKNFPFSSHTSNTFYNQNVSDLCRKETKGSNKRWALLNRICKRNGGCSKTNRKRIFFSKNTQQKISDVMKQKRKCFSFLYKQTRLVDVCVGLSRAENSRFFFSLTVCIFNMFSIEKIFFS